ncbi:TPA: hypothetical protein OZ634_004952, partial [Escherichia coli]|nr:hypothetical protein [Escherichia coli]
MKISLEDKLNLIRAKDYASKLNGVTSFDVSFLRKNDFMWHREMLMAINKTDNIIERRVFNLPLNINDLARDVESTLNVKKDILCNIFYNGDVCISLHVENFLNFILSLF